MCFASPALSAEYFGEDENSRGEFGQWQLTSPAAPRIPAATGPRRFGSCPSPLPPPPAALPAQNSPQAHSGLAAFTPESPVKNTAVGLTKLLPSLYRHLSPQHRVPLYREMGHC